MSELAGKVHEVIPEDARVLVIGEPPIEFYLNRAGRSCLGGGIIGDARLDILKRPSNGPIYLVTGIYSDRAPFLREGIKRLEPQLELLHTFDLNPKDLRLLDDYAPDDARRLLETGGTSHQLRLYRSLVRETQTSARASDMEKGNPGNLSEDL